MKKIGIFVGKSTVKTAQVADKILHEFGTESAELVDVEVATLKDIKKYDYLVLGAATWFDGELPSYWDEMLPEIEDANLAGKKVAIFGLGDQVQYPDNFVDSIGLLARKFEKRDAAIVGYTSCEGYTFTKSKGECEGRFRGLALDFENQQDLNEQRIKNWVKELKSEFK